MYMATPMVGGIKFSSLLRLRPYFIRGDWLLYAVMPSQHCLTILADIDYTRAGKASIKGVVLNGVGELLLSVSLLSFTCDVLQGLDCQYDSNWHCG